MTHQDNQSRLLTLGKRTLTTLARLRLENINVEVNFHLERGDTRLALTVFNSKWNNVSFTFYGFQNPEEVKARHQKVIRAIKLDDFEKVEDFISRGEEFEEQP